MSEEEEKAIWYFSEVLVYENDMEQWKIVENLIDKLQKENQELKEDNSHQWEERCRLTFELEELKEELDYYKQKENQEFDERDYWEE